MAHIWCQVQKKWWQGTKERTRQAFIEPESSSVWKIRMPWGRQELAVIFPGISRQSKHLRYSEGPLGTQLLSPQGHRDFSNQQSMQWKCQPRCLDESPLSDMLPSGRQEGVPTLWRSEREIFFFCGHYPLMGDSVTEQEENSLRSQIYLHRNSVSTIQVIQRWLTSISFALKWE